jgi:hypothetical protein
MFERFRNFPAQGVRFLCFSVPAFWILAGCGSLPNDSSGSIFTVMGINGYYEDSGTTTNQVDVVQSICDAETGDYEFFSDHYVAVDFLNRHLPNRNSSLGTVGSEAEQYTASVIYLKSYEIRYTPGDNVTAPYPLPSPLVIDVTQTIAIPPCSPGTPGQTCPATTMNQGYFVPVATKNILRDYFIEAGEQLQYDVDYIFYGENDFGVPVSATGHYNFYAANYDYCK